MTFGGSIEVIVRDEFGSKIEWRKARPGGWMPESFRKGRHSSITIWNRGNHIECKSSESE